MKRPGDVHVAVPCLGQVEGLQQTALSLEAAAADSAYDFSPAHGELEWPGIRFSVRPQAVLTVRRRSSNGMRFPVSQTGISDYARKGRQCQRAVWAVSARKGGLLPGTGQISKWSRPARREHG